MKSLILLVVLAALTVFAASSPNAALYQEEAYQKDGRFDPDTYYTEIFRKNYRRVGQAGIMQYLDVVFTGNDTTRITAIALSPQPPFENAFAIIHAGGLGSNQAAVLMNSTLGGGFHYMLQVWGYDTTW